MKSIQNHSLSNPSFWRSFFKVAAWGVAALIILVISALIFVTLYLTPQRLSNLIKSQASKYLAADVDVVNPRFTFWSSFPNLEFYSDSILINSHALDSIPQNSLILLPPNYNSLASVSSLKGGINISRLISKGDIVLDNVAVKDLFINLVALNDSVNNYNIFPSSLNSNTKIPFFSANSITVSGKNVVSYSNVNNHFVARSNIYNCSLSRKKNSSSVYILSLPGDVSLSSGNTPLLSLFPFNLNGNIALKFKPFSFSLNDFSVNLGNTHGKLNLDMLVDKDININLLSYALHADNLLDLLHSIPSLSPSLPMNLKADLDLDLNANLSKPFKLSSDSLPSFNVDFSFHKGNIVYTSQNGIDIPINHDKIHASLSFNGDNPALSYINVHPFSLSSSGSRVLLNGDISNLSSSPHCSLNFSGNTNINSFVNLLSRFAKLNSVSAHGYLSFDSSLQFDIPSLSPSSLQNELSNLNLNAILRMKNLSIAAPDLDLNLASNNLYLSLSHSPSSPIHLKLKASNLSYKNPSDSLSISSSGLSAQGFVSLSYPLSDSISSLQLYADNFSVSSPDVSYSGNQVCSSISLGKILQSHSPLPLPPGYESEDNELILASHNHSPQLLQVNLPPNIKKIISSIGFNVNLNAGEGLLVSKYFPLANHIHNIDLSFSNDSAVIRNFNMRSRSSGLHIDGCVSNLLQFLTSPSPAFLEISLNLALDTININQLARAYECGVALTKGVDKVTMPYNDAITPSDSSTFLLPRNLRVYLSASADETIYRNLHLFDLHTDVALKNGDAHVDHLKIGSDFGMLDMNVDYITSDLNNMGLNIDASLDNVGLVNFFKNFHTLLLMMPQMKNLDGSLSVSVNGDVKLFPDMYINMPALHADLEVAGSDLTVHQNDFIRHITKMLLIHSSGDLHINDMLVHASIHDNLVELYPFLFEFDRYKLEMLGTNNFNGDLYYHIGVLKSLVPFPFGINIQGLFHNPQLRFGGPSFRTDKAQAISENIDHSFNVNFPQLLAKYLHEFIQKAAESDDSDNSQYLFDVPDYRNM